MNPLILSDDEYRAAYERMTGIALEFLAAIPGLPTFPDTTGEATNALFAGPLPEEGTGASALDDLEKVIANVRPPNARFFGYVLGSGEPIAASADLLASVLNQNCTAWRSGPSAITIERVVIGWIAESLGCAGFHGSLTGGGSPANLMGLAIAREARQPANEAGVTRRGAVYASTEAHMSIEKAAAMLGIGRDNVRRIPCDEAFRMQPELLHQAIRRDADDGVTPIAVVASAGTTNTGSIDPLPEIANIAAEFGAWLHIDGAYGAFAALTIPEKFAGLNRADSLSLDPHKWLYQPLDCGCLLYRDRAAAQRAFSHSGDYTKSFFENELENFEFFEESMELSRRFRALKLWLSLRYHGLGNFRKAIRNDLDLAQHLAKKISGQSELELLAPVPLSAVCFRYVPATTAFSEPELNALNRQLLQSVVRRGKVFLSNATIHGKFSLRACVVNHRSTQGDVEQVVEEVLAAGREISTKANS